MNRPQLIRALERTSSVLACSRGQGAHMLRPLLTRLRDPGTPLGDAEEGQIAEVIASLTYAMEDCAATTRRMRGQHPFVR